MIFGDLKYCPADTNKDGFINEKNNIKYAGYFYDAETGLYYLNARFYDPETARFIQQDSYSGNILDPLSLNLYTYAQNNPISYYDPTGHSIKSLLKKAKDTVNKAKETVKSAFNNTAKAAKQTVQKAQQTVTKAAAATKNAVVNAANEYKDNWNSGISQLKSSGTAGKLFASYSEGVVGNISNAASASVQFVKDPLGAVSESVDFFLQDPLRNNPVAAVDMNTGNISFGYNGSAKFNPSRNPIKPELQSLIDKTKQLAANDLTNPYANRSSFELWSVDNCAEVYATNNALINGANIDNIFLNTKFFNNGAYAEPCANCRITFKDFSMPKK